ncbi:MAG: hypothetical protein ACRDE2_17815 [Chitinophagaceae bacterium]
MKKVIFILLVLVPFICLGQTMKEGKKIKSVSKNTLPFLKSEGGGYYQLSNNINGKILLKEYVNFNNKSDTIYLEKVLCVYNSGNGGFLFGNIGPHYGLMLSFKYSKGKKVMVDTCERTDYLASIQRERINGNIFYVAKTNHVDQCGEVDFYIIYHLLSYGGLEKIFEDYSKLEYYESSPYCASGESYSQVFHFLLYKSRIFLKVIKRIESPNKKKDYYYLYHDGKFNLCSKCYP